MSIIQNLVMKLEIGLRYLRWRAETDSDIKPTILEDFIQIANHSLVQNAASEYKPAKGYRVGFTAWTTSVDELVFITRELIDNLDQNHLKLRKFENEHTPISLEDWSRTFDGKRVTLDEVLQVLLPTCETLITILKKCVEHNDIPESTVVRRLSPILEDYYQLTMCICDYTMGDVS